jgi:hypothetical protein
VESAGFQERPALAYGPAQFLVPASANQRLPAIRPIEAKDHPHRRGLASTGAHPVSPDQRKQVIAPPERVGLA